MTTATVDPGHPDWCYLPRCTANRIWSGAHRGRLVMVWTSSVSLCAAAADWHTVYVEIDGRRFPAEEAYELGRVVAALAKPHQGLHVTP
jgi:hypothetical protein